MKGLACTAGGISVSGLTLGHLSSLYLDRTKAFHVPEIYPKGGCVHLLEAKSLLVICSPVGFS